MHLCSVKCNKESQPTSDWAFLEALCVSKNGAICSLSDGGCDVGAEFTVDGLPHISEFQLQAAGVPVGAWGSIINASQCLREAQGLPPA